jgi:dienelactone hydrolase
MLVVAALGRAVEGQAPVQARPLWGSLEPGPFAVGFRVVYQLDRSRVWGPTPDSAAGGELARPVRISVWYPARPGTADTRMRYGDYVHFTAPDRYFGRLDSLLEGREQRSARDLFAGAEQDYPKLLALPVAATRDAPPLERRFPLVMYSEGWNSAQQNDNVVLAEYLASHGFVVAAVPQVGESPNDLTLRISPAELEIQMRDLEFAMGVATTLPFVDRRKIGLMGWSMGGVVTLWIAGRNHAVKALVGLDPSYQARDFVTMAMGSPYFDIRRFRAPLLSLRTGNPKYVGNQDDRLVDSLHFAERLLGRVGNVTHGDFSDFAMIAKLFPVTILDRTAEEASWGHEAICREVRAFFDGVLNGDRRALEPKSGSPRPSGLTIAHRAAAEVPSEEEFVALVSREGLTATVARFRQLEARYPGLTIIRYPIMNRLGYRFLREGQPGRALDAFRLNTQAYPSSADGFDSLADGYLAKGDSASVDGAYRQVLELLPRDSTLQQGAREELKARAEEWLRKRTRAR